MFQNVLVLEDSKTQARIVESLLIKAGGTPYIVHNRTEAIRLLKEHTFHLIMLDVFIGLENSLDYLEEFRKLAPNTPIAVMTAGQRDRPLTASQALNKARRADVDFLLPKPFDLNDVRQICDDARRIYRRNGPLKRVLVVDDNAPSRLIFRTYLEEEGFHVAESPSIEDALLRLEMTRVDVILTDIVMEGIGGLTGIKIITATWPEVPIVAMTGYLKNGDNLQNALLKGARQVIKKPFNQFQLQQAINRALTPPGTPGTEENVLLI
ncbi:MAG: response regulator [Asticcacaulis sp.]